MDVNQEYLEIHTLGMFIIKKGNIVITEKYNRSQKPLELLKYLISNKDTSVNPEVIAEVICKGNDYNNPIKAVHNLVYRLRNMLMEDDKKSASSIRFVNGCYKLDVNTMKLDIHEFEGLCQKGNTLAGINKDEAVTIYKRALELYKGRFLHENEYDDWAITTRNYYHNLYLKSVNSLIKLYDISHRHDDIINLCEKSLLHDFFDEDIHINYLKALIEKGKARQALAHYEYATTRLYKQAGISPSSEMSIIYRNIKHGKSKIEFSLSTIEEQLNKENKSKGALFCDLDIFRFIYTLEKHQVERSKESIFLVLVTLVHNDDIILSPLLLKEEMAKLTDLLIDTLRRSDVLTQWSSAQYLLLLFGLKHEHIEMIFNRITDAYNKCRKNQDIRLIKNIKQL